MIAERNLTAWVDLMRLQCLVGSTFVSVFVQEAVDFMKIKLTPVCLQSGDAFEVTVREVRHMREA